MLERRFGDTVDIKGVPNFGITDPLINDLTVKANVYLNILSIVGGGIVVLITFILWCYDRRFVNRVSLRLNLAISIIDIVKAALIFSYTFADSSSGWWCGFSVWFITQLTIWYLFLSAAIAFNLQWIILSEKPLYPWMERYIYFLGTFLASLAVTLPAYIAGRFGFDRAQGSCWFVDSWTTTSKIWEWFTFVMPTLLTIIYCNVVVGFVVAKIYKGNRALNKSLRSTGNVSSSANSIPQHISSLQRRTQLAVNRVLARIVLYPLIPFITQTLIVTSEIYIMIRVDINQPLSLAGNAATDLPGILNCIAFLIDPAVANAFGRIRRDLIERYANRPATSTREQFMKWFVRVILRGRRKQPQPFTATGTGTYHSSQLNSFSSKHERWQKLEDKPIPLQPLPPSTVFHPFRTDNPEDYTPSPMHPRVDLEAPRLATHDYSYDNEDEYERPLQAKSFISNL
ncbi:uncharacterized protein VTP21DRAFT_5579 [Calcarisporiella thermophila]|uniref:uncharacterized protein n=1 Tax=Calcarisporiella thermophila TaxID=911321 RepID=UPI003743DE46